MRLELIQRIEQRVRVVAPRPRVRLLEKLEMPAGVRGAARQSVGIGEEIMRFAVVRLDAQRPFQVGARLGAVARGVQAAEPVMHRRNVGLPLQRGFKHAQRLLPVAGLFQQVRQMQGRRQIAGPQRRGGAQCLFRLREPPQVGLRNPQKVSPFELFGLDGAGSREGLRRGLAQPVGIERAGPSRRPGRSVAGLGPRLVQDRLHPLAHRRRKLVEAGAGSGGRGGAAPQDNADTASAAAAGSPHVRGDAAKLKDLFSRNRQHCRFPDAGIAAKTGAALMESGRIAAQPVRQTIVEANRRTHSERPSDVRFLRLNGPCPCAGESFALPAKRRAWL